MVFGHFYHNICYYFFLTRDIMFLASFLHYYLLLKGRGFTVAFPLRNKPTPETFTTPGLLLGQWLDMVSGHL